MHGLRKSKKFEGCSCFSSINLCTNLTGDLLSAGMDTSLTFWLLWTCVIMMQQVKEVRTGLKKYWSSAHGNEDCATGDHAWRYWEMEYEINVVPAAYFTVNTSKSSWKYGAEPSTIVEYLIRRDRNISMYRNSTKLFFNSATSCSLLNTGFPR